MKSLHERLMETMDSAPSMNEKLTPTENAWCNWLDRRPAVIRTMHEGAQAVSLAAFEAGTAAERARIRRELMDICPPAGPIQGDRSTIDRICPEEG